MKYKQCCKWSSCWCHVDVGCDIVGVIVTAIVGVGVVLLGAGLDVLRVGIVADVPLVMLVLLLLWMMLSLGGDGVACCGRSCAPKRPMVLTPNALIPESPIITRNRTTPETLNISTFTPTTPSLRRSFDTRNPSRQKVARNPLYSRDSFDI